MSTPVSIAILAAGLGTRMKSKMAKVLHQAGGMPLVEHVVRAAISLAGDPERVVTVVGHQAAVVRAALAAYGTQFAEQTEQKGTGHALLMCQDQLAGKDGVVVVLYGDTPLLQASTVARLIALYRESGAAGAVLTTVVDNPTGYGRIIRNAAGNVTAIVEEKAATAEQKLVREINSGIYCFDAARLWRLLPAIAPNPASGEIYLTDLVEALNAEGAAVVPMVLEDPSELLGINNRVELAQADAIFRARKVHELMIAGVTIVKPETVVIDVDVVIGQDTIVEPYAQIRGNTRIGPDCHIGAGSIIRDSVLEAGVLVDAYTLIGTSHLGPGVHAGPFTRLRLGNRLGAGAHVGNFVELKNTELGAGSKSMHLAYLGDSVIGDKVNIGAGTITCNYDGKKKHKTRIGSGSFVGSNSTLVAPMEIGDGAYVAAGSVITTPVPGDTLALGRSRQTNKPGWPSARSGKSE